MSRMSGQHTHYSEVVLIFLSFRSNNTLLYTYVVLPHLVWGKQISSPLSLTLSPPGSPPVASPALQSEPLVLVASLHGVEGKIKHFTIT